MHIEQTFYVQKGEIFMERQNEIIKMKMKKLDERLLKMVNEKNIDSIIEFIEDFLCKLQ